MGKGEREGEKHQCERYINQLPLAPPPHPTWDPGPQLGMFPAWIQASNLSVHRLVLNPLSHTRQGYIPHISEIILYMSFFV